MEKLISLEEAGKQMYNTEHILYKEINGKISTSQYETTFKIVDKLKRTEHSSVLEIVFVKEGDIQSILAKKDAMLAFGDDLFDYCFTINTIYFLKDPISHFQEIYRVLRPGGSFSLFFKEKKFGGNLPWTQADFTFYDINEVEKFFMESGFVNIEVKQISEETPDRGGKEMITHFINIAGSKQAG